MFRRCSRTVRKPLTTLFSPRSISFRLATPVSSTFSRSIRPVLTPLARPFHTSRPLLAQPGLPPAKPNAAGILQYRLTDVGEGIAECELLRWFKNEGDPLQEFDRLCEVQSDK